jgi:hypothetical protein
MPPLTDTRDDSIMTTNTIPETVSLVGTSYIEDLEAEVPNKPWRDFSLFASPPPMLDESSESSFSSVDDGNIQPDLSEVRLSADSVSFFTPENKHVRFSTVEIREYDMIVGDHPCCSAGLPLSLDWKYNPVPIIQQAKDFSGTKRPPQKLSLLERMHLLKKFYSSTELWMVEGDRRHQQDLEEEHAALHHAPSLAGIFCQEDDEYECTIIVEPDDCEIFSCEKVASRYCNRK